MEPKKRNRILWYILAAAAAAALGFLAWRAGWFALFTDRERLRALVARAGVWGPLVFFLLQAAQVLFAPIPGNVTTLVGGALFGFRVSFFLSILAVFTGSCIAFFLARRFGMALVRRVAGQDATERYLRFLRGRSTLMLGLMFLFPAFPDDMLCFLAGLTPISFPGFALLVLLTRPWGLLGSSLIGAGSLAIPWWGWGLLGALCLAALLLSARFGPQIEDGLMRFFRRLFGKDME